MEQGNICLLLSKHLHLNRAAFQVYVCACCVMYVCYVCMCVHVYVCVHVCVCVCVCVCVSACVHVYRPCHVYSHIIFILLGMVVAMVADMSILIL